MIIRIIQKERLSSDGLLFFNPIEFFDQFSEDVVLQCYPG